MLFNIKYYCKKYQRDYFQKKKLIINKIIIIKKDMIIAIYLRLVRAREVSRKQVYNITEVIVKVQYVSSLEI